MKSQEQLVLGYLKKHNKITSKKAFKKFGITRLSSVIHRLRNDGYIITTDMERGKNMFCERVCFAVYKFYGEGSKQ